MSVTRERQLVATFVEVADTLVDDFDVIDLLHTLAERCVQLLDVDAAGIMLIDQRGHLRAAAASTENARLVELFELQTDAGPCIDCCRSGEPVINADLDAHAERWPRFAEAARSSGFVAVHALPLRLRETIIGALNLFSEGEGAIGDQDKSLARALADVATIGILQQRSVHQGRVLTDQLQHALNSRVVVEQAKGILAERHNLSVTEAYGRLRRHARDHNLKVSELAGRLVQGESLPDG